VHDARECMGNAKLLSCGAGMVISLRCLARGGVACLRGLLWHDVLCERDDAQIVIFSCSAVLRCGIGVALRLLVGCCANRKYDVMPTWSETAMYLLHTERAFSCKDIGFDARILDSNCSVDVRVCIDVVMYVRQTS
jgi:hypothetical protein